jgi:hypothetical protein
MNKRSPSYGQNDQLVHWWVLFPVKVTLVCFLVRECNKYIFQKVVGRCILCLRWPLYITLASGQFWSLNNLENHEMKSSKMSK